jgi:hypothetical protein
VGVVGIVLAMYAGYGVVATSNMSLICEFSSFFLNYRSTYTKEELGLPIPLLNQFIFFFSFTACRMVLFPFGMWMQARNCYMTWNWMDDTRKIVSIVALTLYMSMYCLFLVWYKLILKGFIRGVQGLLSKSPKKSSNVKPE